MRRCLLFLFLIANPFRAECACGTLMPYSSMTYLDQTLLTRYGLTDPCTLHCRLHGRFLPESGPILQQPPHGSVESSGLPHQRKRPVAHHVRQGR